MRVEISPPSWATHFLSDLTDWRKEPVPVAEMGPFELPEDSYFEYAFADAEGNRRPDPANDNPRLNPWWEYACHLTGPEYRPDPTALLPSRRPQGRVLRLEIDSKILGESRRVLVYSPAGCADLSLPHVVFQDGKAYFGWGKVPQVLDHLLGRGEVGPAHLVFIPPRERTREYAFNPAYRRFVVEEVLPQVVERVPSAGRHIAWGASLGGLLSATLAWENSRLFGKVVAQSGAFLFSEDMDLEDPFRGNESFRKLVLSGGRRDLEWYLECGTLEWLADSNRRLFEALGEQGHQAELHFRNAGHNWVNWRNGIAAGLRFALGV
jgi:enterochelin esterase-like enzyme